MFFYYCTKLWIYKETYEAVSSPSVLAALESILKTFILFYFARACSRDPTQSIADRVKEMYDIYCQCIQSEGEFSNFSKGEMSFNKVTLLS